MEHKIIEGGEQYLPFARSRIKALRAGGQRYASQRFEVDGVSIDVQIVDDEEYIRIKGGTCVLQMDSGMVDVVSTNYIAEEASHRVGTLHETTRTSGYNASFTEPDGDYLLNPGETSSGQLSGAISKSGKIKGRIKPGPQDAQSFAPKLVLEPGEPLATFAYSPNDDDLLAKKTTAVNCPASIFTGRCRLYVQALYGRRLYNYSDSMSVGEQTELTSAPDKSPVRLAVAGTDLNGRPFLTVQAYAYKDEPATSISVTTSTGVHLDVVTGKHWLFNIQNNSIQVYPLRGTACAESMRKYLKIPLPAGVEALSEDDKEHVEAYILSQCLPDVRHMQTTTSGANIPTHYSMGYGWHWNWTGLQSNIVITTSVNQDAPGYECRESTHYGLTMSRTLDEHKNATWSASLTTIEGPKQWAAIRDNWTIFEPLWSGNFLQKTTSRLCAMFACDAPFYAFYRKDTLQTCRITVTQTGDTEEQMECSPADFEEGYIDPITGNWTRTNYTGLAKTNSMSGGRSRFRQKALSYWTAEFKCAGITMSNLSVGETRAGFTREVSGKTLTSPRYFGAVGSAGWTSNVLIGCPPSTQTVSNGGGLATQPWADLVSYNYDLAYFTEYYACEVMVVVPLFDSECVWARGTRTRNYGESTRTRATHQGYGYALGTRVHWYSAVDGSYAGNSDYSYCGTWYGDLDGTVGAPLLTTPVVEAEIVMDVWKVSCRAGVLDTLPYYIAFEAHANAEETLFDSFKTLTSYSFSNTCVIAQTEKLAPVGIDPAVVTAPPFEPVLVGWA